MPGQKKDQQTWALTEFVDIYPTLCDLAGLPKPPHLDGESLIPILENPQADHKPHIFSRFHKGESVKTDRYVYSEWIDPDSDSTYARMLYDHQTDSLENNNVAEEEEYASVVAELNQVLTQRRRESEAK